MGYLPAAASFRGHFGSKLEAPCFRSTASRCATMSRGGSKSGKQERQEPPERQEVAAGRETRADDDWASRGWWYEDRPRWQSQDFESLSAQLASAQERNTSLSKQIKILIQENEELKGQVREVRLENEELKEQVRDVRSLRVENEELQKQVVDMTRACRPS